ncbi:proton extrusion protein PcxA [Scytonema hofmannii PCC 7110]|uniref:Proton extrusion protein PxcA n=1 Tax=Scytonema hofmannii PCC 7110 TaxID=128403 RepID=A0A139XC99_9CYAN|nr:proton extrusion protein PcxA [Scytonema hofmannii]KYC42320.1 proton extrusion protein PcxA [Scytonema hofmannii PCC 7110]
MINSFYRQKIYPFLLKAYYRYLQTSERSLDKAYRAALQIKAIEDEHFNGNKIHLDSTIHSGSVTDYFESDLKRQLKIIRMRLTEFKFSRFFLDESNQKAAKQVGIEYSPPSLILEKLNFIDEVITKYNTFKPDEVAPNTLSPPSKIVPVELTLNPTKLKNPSKNKPDNTPRSKTNATGVLPRSIFNTITRLQIELDPNAEQDVVKNFRNTQKRTIISVRFLLLLIIVPILTHQISKALFVGPIVESYFSKHSEQAKIFLNYEMEEEALTELERFEERIKFKSLISNNEILSQEQMELEVKKKAREIAEEFQQESGNAIKNVFADILSVIAFTWLLLMSKREIAVLKDFFDHVVYGLSDSAKAFIIILFTDIFVGFHSPHGWEVILEGVSRHWGLPANHDFIFLFIATFPVILDTIFKYWIFRYLNRISPSAVATYHNMNE